MESHCSRLRQSSRLLFQGQRLIETRWVAKTTQCLRTITVHIDSRSRISNVFIPPYIKPRPNETRDGTSLLHDAGFVRKAAAGIFYTLPLGLRVQEKLCRLADEAMKRVGASKMELPTLSPAHLWRKSNRWITNGDELFRFQDRKHSEFCLVPTNEEDITDVVGGSTQSWRTLPVRVYQITRKFRDEKRPRAGLLRGREFLMKDMYSFDVDEAAAMDTYVSVREAYDWFFNKIGLPFETCEADSGNIGGSLCHEYHYKSDAGEDILYLCKKCNYAKNEEVHISKDDDDYCPKCRTLDALYTSTAIELGHTFYLGTKYTSSFNATYMPQDDDSKRNLIHMGCYGLGISRMIAAIAQLCHDEVGLKWPESVAPWRCIVLQPRTGGGEEMYDAIASAMGSDNVIFDDRRYATIGAKMHDAKRIGFPWIAALGRKWETNGLVELVNRWTGEIQYVEKSVLQDPNFWNQPAQKDLAAEGVAQAQAQKTLI